MLQRRVEPAEAEIVPKHLVSRDNRDFSNRSAADDFYASGGRRFLKR